MSNTAAVPSAAAGWNEGRGERIAWALWRTAAILLCAAVSVASNFLPLEKHFEPPVIRGVQEKLELYEDDDIEAALTAGVTATGGEDRPDETFPVLISVFAESGEEAGEYLPGTYRLVYTCGAGAGREAQPVESVLIVMPADREGPVFAGLHDWTVTAGETISYREGVAATDKVDGTVRFEVNAEQVDLAQSGEYTAVYRAADSRGNETVAAIHITVLEPEPPDEEIVAGDGTSYGVNKSDLDGQADALLARITTPEMTPRQKAWAIYSYVNGHIRYVNTSDKSSWITAAFVGLTQGRGDCFNYFALSKELLDRAGIPNIDLYRVGGASDHYWQLVQIDGGWYHFDACPHPNGYPITSFLLTEAEVRAYSAQFSGFYANYYTYDYAACPVVVAGTPEEAPPAEPSGNEEDIAVQPPQPEETPGGNEGAEFPATGAEEGNVPEGQTPQPEDGEDTDGQTGQPEGGEDTEGQTPQPEGGEDTEGQTSQPGGGENTDGQTGQPEGGEDTGGKTPQPEDTEGQTSQFEGGENTGNQIPQPKGGEGDSGAELEEEAPFQPEQKPGE